MKDAETYQGEGDVIWYLPGDVWQILYPVEPYRLSINLTDMAQGSAAFTVASITDILSINLAANTAKLMWQIGAFSVILLQPILEAILVKDEPASRTRPSK